MKRTCQDCGAPLTGHGTPTRCRRCGALARYIAKHGKPPEMLVANCGSCGLEFRDYASNHKKEKHGAYFCSAECRSAWTTVHNSISRGGDGVLQSKSEKDALHYRKCSDKIRNRVKARYLRHREVILARLREKDRALKAEVIAAYGGKCTCCGETHHEFLTIDHTDGSGAEHRRQVGKGRQVYQDLKRRGFPKEGFALLCLNCNTALGFYGYCPHRPEIRRVINKVPRNPGRKRTIK